MENPHLVGTVQTYVSDTPTIVKVSKTVPVSQRRVLWSTVIDMVT